MRHLLLALMVLLTASAAVAESYLDMEDFSVNSTQQTITVPIRAHFNGRVSGFQVDVTYPDGLTPVDARRGADMTVSYLNDNGAQRQKEATYFSNADYTRLMAVFMDYGYWDQDNDGEFETYGVIKWEAGEYDEMILLTLEIDEGFTGGEIVLQSEVDAGDDTRGGTVRDLGEASQINTHVCVVTVEHVDLTGNIEISEQCPGVVSVTYSGIEDVYLTVFVNGEEVSLQDGLIQLPYPGTWHITAIAEAYGYNPLYNDYEYVWSKVVPAAPVINYEINDTEVLVFIEWPESDGEHVYNGQLVYLREFEDSQAEVDAYVTEGTFYAESEHAHAIIPIPALPDPGPDPDPDDYSLTMADAEVLHGRTVVIPVSMTNYELVTALQTDLYLPDGFELQNIELTQRKSDHSITWNTMSDGAVRILSYSPSLMTYNDYEGVLFNVTLKVPDNAAGDYTLYLKNSLLTTENYAEIHCADATSNLNVWAYIPGDANGDGVVDVSDVVATAQYILGYDPNPFVFEAADMNGDGQMTVTDVVLITRIILDPTYVDLMCAPARGVNNDAMSAKDIQISAGETRTVAIALDNEFDYTAFQLDIQLPDGLIAANFRLTDRAGSHTFSTSEVEGLQRVMCYSPVLAAIDGHEGALLTFDVTATGDVSSDIMVDGIELVTAACGTVRLDAFTIGVNSDGLTSVKEMADALRIYTDGNDIIVESPVSQQVVICDVAGRSYTVDVTEGRNVIPARFSGVVVVTAGNKTAKLMVK